MNIVNKLKTKPEQALWLLNCPEQCLALLEGVELKKFTAAAKNVAQILVFAENKAMLNKQLTRLEGKLNDDVIFWIAYPKKSGSIQSDIVRNEGWTEVFKQYEGVSSISIDDDWSGMRFKKKGMVNSGWVPMEERKVEGVDYINRTVKLPADAVKAMKPYKGLEDFFYTMSFTHTREYIEAIADAKKPETRQRRIEKMIEMVQKIKEAKEAKKRK